MSSDHRLPYFMCRNLLKAGCCVAATMKYCFQIQVQNRVVVSFSRNIAGLSAEAATAALEGTALTFITVDGQVKPPVTVTPSDSLSVAIELLASSKVESLAFPSSFASTMTLIDGCPTTATEWQVHRLYIVDLAARPIGAISVTDVIRLVLSHSITAFSMTDSVA